MSFSLRPKDSVKNGDFSCHKKEVFVALDGRMPGTLMAAMAARTSPVITKFKNIIST